MKDRTALLVQLGIAIVTIVAPAFAGAPAATPEPASILLIGGGIGALILVGRWKRSRQ